MSRFTSRSYTHFMVLSTVDKILGYNIQSLIRVPQYKSSTQRLDVHIWCSRDEDQTSINKQKHNCLLNPFGTKLNPNALEGTSSPTLFYVGKGSAVVFKIGENYYLFLSIYLSIFALNVTTYS